MRNFRIYYKFTISKNKSDFQLKHVRKEVLK